MGPGQDHGSEPFPHLSGCATGGWHAGLSAVDVSPGVDEHPRPGRERRDPQGGAGARLLDHQLPAVPVAVGRDVVRRLPEYLEGLVGPAADRPADGERRVGARLFRRQRRRHDGLFQGGADRDPRARHDGAAGALWGRAGDAGEQGGQHQHAGGATQQPALRTGLRALRQVLTEGSGSLVHIKERSMKQVLKNERGMALAVAIVALVIVGALVAGALFSGTQEQRVAENTRRVQASFGVAEEGVNSLIRVWPNSTTVWNGMAGYPATAPTSERSEERRVGKEGRSRWSPYH